MHIHIYFWSTDCRWSDIQTEQTTEGCVAKPRIQHQPSMSQFHEHSGASSVRDSSGPPEQAGVSQTVRLEVRLDYYK